MVVSGHAALSGQHSGVTDVKTLVLKSVYTGHLHTIRHGERVGRSSQCRLNLTMPDVSRHHAEFLYNEEKNTWSIRDLGSLNGFRINHVLYPTDAEGSDTQALLVGDRLSIGLCQFLVSEFRD